MTNEPHEEEGAEEAIEDLEAPAGAGDNVLGGVGIAKEPNCPGNSCSPSCLGGSCQDGQGNSSLYCFEKTETQVMVRT
jgi:hypothetical protein